jgi:cell division septation protein DedD
VPQDKPIVVKEAASKPKHMKEPAKAPTAPLLATLETKPEMATQGGQSVQTDEQPEVVAQEPVIAQDSSNIENQAAANNQQTAIAGQTANENTPQETPPVETVSKPPGSSKQYTIQVASLREADKADIVKDKFRQKGYPAYCQSSPVRGEVWHRVRIGPYPDKTIAEKDCRRLEEAGFDALMLIVNP